MNSTEYTKRIWQFLPKSFRNPFWKWYNHETIGRARSSKKPVPSHAPIVIAGMFRTASGLGAWARSTYRVLVDAGYNVIAVDLSDHLASADIQCDIPFSEFPKSRTGTLILHVNAPEVAISLRKLGLRRGRSWRVIGAWAWELDVFPTGWDAAFPLVSEIWTLSDFSANSLRQHRSAPSIDVLPICVSPPGHLVSERETRSIRKPFKVLTMADALSTLSRKNPIGAIQAFRKAFEDDPDYQLILKLRNFQPGTEQWKPLEAALADAANIEVIGENLSSEEQWSIIADSSAFISLHRAEGFGLGVAESMSLGIPVVTTGWSGNMSFCSDKSACLVDYSMTPIPTDYPHYGNMGAKWAEPEIDHAAHQLRRLSQDPDLIEELGLQGRHRIAEYCASEPVTEKLTSLIERKG